MGSPRVPEASPGCRARGDRYNLLMPTIALGGADAGARLDRFLVGALGVSRSQARRLLASGAVSLEGRTLGYGDKGLPLPSRGVLEVAPFRLPGEQRARPAAACDRLGSSR